MEVLIKTIDWLNEYVGRAIAWLSSGLVALICYDVTMRYLFRYTKIWIVELEWHLFSFLFLLGIAYTFLHDRHVRVDVFYARYSPKGKAWINLLGTIFFLIPLCVVVLMTSFDFATRAYQWGEASADPGGLPFRWIVKSGVFIGFALLGLQALSHIARNILIIIGKDAPSTPTL
ncbi:MAG: TRAP transporter small permease subunit [Bacteroidota bacterium]